MKLNELLLEKIKDQGLTKKYVAEQINVNYKSFVYRINNDVLTAYDLFKIAKLLNIDLEKLRNNTDIFIEDREFDNDIITGYWQNKPVILSSVSVITLEENDCVKLNYFGENYSGIIKNNKWTYIHNRSDIDESKSIYKK